MKAFGKQIAYHRRECRDPEKGGVLTQSRFAELLQEYDETLIYTKTQISNWENGKRVIPLDKRNLLIGFIFVFTTYGSLKELETANAFLQIGGYAPLTEDEVGKLPEKKLFWKDKLSKSGEVLEGDGEEQGSQTLLTIAGIIKELEKQTGDNEKLEGVLAEIESQRISAILNLSQTQRQILEAIPVTPTPLDYIFAKMHSIEKLEGVRIKELNLRLHELRYLGLINRKKDPEYRWLYWKEEPRSLFS